jgi:hypothetical protein
MIFAQIRLAGRTRPLRDILRRFASWIEDSDGYYVNRGRPSPATPSWRKAEELFSRLAAEDDEERTAEGGGCGE